MQQIAVNQMNGTSGGSLRQKLDLSDACQATDAFAMLFMQLMGQTIQPEALLQIQGEQPFAQTDAVLPAAAGTVGSMASGNEMQAMLADLIQNAGSTPAEGAYLQTFAMQSMDTVPGTAAAEGTVQGAELLEGEAEGMQQLYTVLKAAWGGEESSSLMENGFSSLQAGNAFRTARQLLEQQEKETVVPVDVESLQADVNAGRFLTAQPEAAQLPLPSAKEIGKRLKTGILHQTVQGKSEFIVRLEPEGIGEIVVKISDDREHMALSIFTASTQAARLISNEIATLQEALRPLQVQVQQVTLLPTEQAVSYASQSALADQGQQQSFAQQYFEQRQQHRGGHWQQEDDSFDAVIGQTQVPDSELDAYI